MDFPTPNVVPSFGSVNSRSCDGPFRIGRKVEANFLANIASYETTLSAKSGPPTEARPDNHGSIPINGQLRHAIWTVGKERLYPVVSHEDTELPWVISLGVTVWPPESAAADDPESREPPQ